MSANARLDEFFEKAAKSRLPDNKRANVPVPKAPKIRRPTKILIYEALLSFLKSACSDRTPELQTILDGHLLSMASDNVVGAIVGSLECRKKLLKLSVDLGLANDPKLRGAVRADDETIATLLVSIFNSKSAEEAVLCLEGDSAQYFLDVVQDMLDKGFLLEQEHSRMAHRIIRKLSEACDRLPSSLFITGVSGREEHPTFGGGYGDIFRASHSSKPVALKRMRHFLRGSDLRRIRLKFCREALVWKDLHHQHILPFLGIDRDSFPSSFCMVSPWMEHGTVVTYLKDHGHANVGKLLYEISQGLQYLHSRNIVHGDLRGANILINEAWSACLADFGLSIFSDITSSMSTNRGGSLYWMAPELLDPDRFGTKFIRTPATDVYAFGCVCLELYTGRRPFSDLLEPAALMKVINGERPDRPTASPAMSDILWQHITEFWAQIPTTRPLTDLVVRNMVWPIPGVESFRPLPLLDTSSAPLAAPSSPFSLPVLALGDSGEERASASESSSLVSGMPTGSERSEGRLSKYAPSSEGSHILHFHLHRHPNGDDFSFPRPETDEEIEALSENVKRTRDLGDLPDLPIEQKWNLFYNDCPVRWKEDKAREDQARKQVDSGQPAPIMHDSPEWFIRKFLDKTITPKQAGSLLVSLRSKELSWFRRFIAIRGTSVLAQTLMHLSRKGASRREFDIYLGYEVVKCLKQILNNPSATKEALTHNLVVTQVASSLNTPHLPTRKLLLDLLSFLAYWNDGEAHSLVVAALEALSSANNEGDGCYDYWFKSMELSLSGRGKMGRLVGASEEVKKTGGIDNNLNEYTVANLVLINGVIGFVEDLDLRLHHRAQMESAGLQRIIALCRGFGVPTIDKQLRILQAVLDDDDAKLRERRDQRIPQDVYEMMDVRIRNTAKTRARHDLAKASAPLGVATPVPWPPLAVKLKPRNLRGGEH